MTTEIEKKFFDTFEIEPKTGIGPVKFKEPHYPQITDRILLELIVIMTQHVDIIHGFDNLEELKTWTLEALIYGSYIIKHQVQAIFKESEQE